MKSRDINVYNGERRQGGQNNLTTVISGFPGLRLAFHSPELVGAKNEITVHKVDGTKEVLPPGGFFGRLGYTVMEIDTPDYDISTYEPTLEISPRMSAAHVAELGEFLGQTMVAKGLIYPGESGISMQDYTTEEPTVTRIAESAVRPNHFADLAPSEAQLRQADLALVGGDVTPGHQAA